MAQLVERVLGKDEVPGPNPGSSLKYLRIVLLHDTQFSFSAKHTADRGIVPWSAFLLFVGWRNRHVLPFFLRTRLWFISDMGADRPSDLRCSLWKYCRTAQAG